MSWLTSLIALLIGLAPVWGQIRWLLSGGNIAGAAATLNKHYNPLAGDRAALAQGYGSLIGGLVFKIATSELTKRAKMTSVIPALHA